MLHFVSIYPFSLEDYMLSSKVQYKEYLEFIRSLNENEIGDLRFEIREVDVWNYSYFADRPRVSIMLKNNDFDIIDLSCENCIFNIEKVCFTMLDFGFANLEVHFSAKETAENIDALDLMRSYQKISEAFYIEIENKNLNKEKLNRLYNVLENNITKFYKILRKKEIVFLKKPWHSTPIFIESDYADVIFLDAAPKDSRPKEVVDVLRYLSAHEQEFEVCKEKSVQFLPNFTANFFVVSDDVAKDFSIHISSCAISAWCIVSRIETEAKNALWWGLQQRKSGLSALTTYSRLQSFGKIALTELEPSRASGWGEVMRVYDRMWSSWNLHNQAKSTEDAIKFARETLIDSWQERREKFERTASMVIVIITLIAFSGFILQSVDFLFASSAPSARWRQYVLLFSSFATIVPCIMLWLHFRRSNGD